MTTELDVTPLQADLAALLRAARDAERDLFSELPAARRETPATIGDWSAKDVLAHLAAWRAIEARRLEATRRGEPNPPADPVLHAPVDESNARIHEDFAGAGWEQVEQQADESVQALLAAIGRSTNDILCECHDDIVGIGANGTNHAMAHLSDIANLADDFDRYRVFALDIERILARGHLPPRDSGVMLYNLACHYALAADLDDARRLLRIAFAHRADLRQAAVDDPDLASLRGELDQLN